MINEIAQIGSFRTLPKGTLCFTLDGHVSVNNNVIVKIVSNNMHTVKGRVQRLLFDMNTYTPSLIDNNEEPDICFDYEHTLPYSLPTSIFGR